ncbi:MAG: DUF4301 family protein [Deltaproteobacteria bacterium]|nr:DUF4301 family protein [Deltaproteobacteria bacterium]
MVKKKSRKTAGLRKLNNNIGRERKLMAHFPDEKDKAQIASMGISEEKIERELETFKKGIPFIHIEAPCTIGHGIETIDDDEIESFISLFKKAVNSGRAMKFTPASGAASRMFKLLLSFYNDLDRFDKEEILHRAVKGESDFENFLLFFDSIKKFPFFEDLKKTLADNAFEIENLLSEKEYKRILEYLLTEKGLNCSNKPKGLIPFHRYDNNARTPFEEHLSEAESYAKDKHNICKIHFTINDEYRDSIQNKIESYTKEREKRETPFQVTYSSQRSSTNTIAADMDNNPFRDKKGSLLFRPAGHGALLENLNSLNGDIVFIKNIDNVTPDRLKETTILYKKALGGYLVKIQEEIFAILKKIEAKDFNIDFTAQTLKYMRERLSLVITEEIEVKSEADRAAFIFSSLNRPIRVCGMVKNEGEPGGGPFWVKNHEGSTSRQIVEKAQINLDDEKQRQSFQRATHFNPVDLICGIRDYKGKPFNLTDYSDPESGFISIKSSHGKKLKALELPGLWNGAMAKWITLFVEVPIATFTPVKTVFDLLRKEHQPG